MTAQGRGGSDDNNNSPKTHSGTIVDRFFEIVKIKAAAASKDATFKDAWGGKNTDYAIEQQIIQQHTRPFVWGIGSALITFASFRLSKSSAVRPGGILHNIFGWSSGAKKMNIPSNNINNTNYAAGVGHTGGNTTNREAMSKALTIPIDLALSFLIGSSASLFLFEKDRAMRDMAGTPLVQGRSLVSETLCKDFITEHKKLSNDFWDRDHSEYPSLDAINSFVLNCKKRNSYEKFLKKVRRTPTGEPVVVPTPGVPPMFNFVDEDESADETENMLGKESFDTTI